MTHVPTSDTKATRSTVESFLHNSVEKSVEPVRRSVIRKFPLLFLFLVTAGITATQFGIEQILIEYTYFREQPWTLLVFGVGLLILTGQLYKKLG